MNSSSIPTLITQLQARYPTASLTSELLAIHEGSYVVRAVVQVGQTSVATGLAAAVDIEQAEDRAKYRALACLGLDQVSALASPQPTGYSLMASPLFQGTADLATSQTSAPPLPTNSPLPPPIETPDRTEPVTQSDSSIEPSIIQPQPVADLTPQPAAEAESGFSPANFDYGSTDYGSADHSPDYTPGYTPDYNPDYAAIQFDPTAASPEGPIEPAIESFLPTASELIDPSVPVVPEVEVEAGSAKSRSTASEKATSPKKTTKRKPDPIETPPPAGEADRSEEIAKIGLEMKRLGWTTEQGRNYLKRTYGKRSRQELDDAELIDFLRYLEFQPSPSESPF